jgi:hypothetical protein
LEALFEEMGEELGSVRPASASRLLTEALRPKLDAPLPAFEPAIGRRNRKMGVGGKCLKRSKGYLTIRTA